MDNDESFLSKGQSIGISATDEVHMSAPATAASTEVERSASLPPVSLDAEVSI